MKDKVCTEDKRGRNRGRETEEQRTGTVEYSHKNGTLGQLIDRIQRTGDKEQSREARDRGRGIQGTET